MGISGKQLPSVRIYSEGASRIDFAKLRYFIRQVFGIKSICLIKLKDPLVLTKGLVLDLLNTQKAFSALSAGKFNSSCNIIITSRLMATFDDFKRLHIRSAVFSYPSIISLPGIVEGPAKPRGYYLLKQKYTRLGAWQLHEIRVKDKFKARLIDYGDKRITEVVKGYLSQAILFFLNGEPFCRIKSCRLFNAHWQEELIYSQIKSGKFCKVHLKAITRAKTLLKSIS